MTHHNTVAVPRLKLVLRIGVGQCDEHLGGRVPVVVVGLHVVDGEVVAGGFDDVVS